MTERDDDQVPTQQELLQMINKISEASQKVYEAGVTSGKMDDQLNELTPPLYEGDINNRVISLPDGTRYVLREGSDGLGRIEPLMGGGGS